MADSSFFDKIVVPVERTPYLRAPAWAASMVCRTLATERQHKKCSNFEGYFVRNVSDESGYNLRVVKGSINTDWLHGYIENCGTRPVLTDVCMDKARVTAPSSQPPSVATLSTF